ncbi:DUF2577 domain-containing protein [Clostridium sp. AWRP]|uniref:DUF2577 domain-containing protein n=1 Tax=Clostridium sp. AWRP TaxID=2212991 RepID=UPI000FDCD956|nr:DUF2577 domain-containing protein [Clostridium sp. AWRP]AZV56803.1 DUF2577 domain-containing protein [Clostridium sp. AWRP]
MGARWDVKLANEFKKRNNEIYTGVVVGTVTSINPLTISILNGAGLFSGDNLYICKNATEYKMNVTVSVTTDRGNYTGTGTATHEGLKEKDRVAVIATEDGGKLFVIDKL